MLMLNDVRKNERNRCAAFIVLFVFTFIALKWSYNVALIESGNIVPPTTEKPTQCVANALKPTEQPTTELETTTEPTIQETTRTETEPSETNSNYLGYFWCTSYCSCAECCQQYAYNRPTDEQGNEIVIGASGQVLTAGRSVAVDTSIIPFGTVLVIDGQEYIAQDTGVSGNRLDFYYSSHEEALSHANHWCEVYIK